MKNFPFDLADEDYLAYRPGGTIKQDLLLHQHAQTVFARLQGSSELPFHGVWISDSDQQFARSLVELVQTYLVLELSNFSTSARFFETTILYEYHPYIEVLLEFLLRRLGCTLWGTRGEVAEALTLRSCTRIPLQDMNFRRNDHSIFSLAECALEVLNPLQMLYTQPVSRAIQQTQETQLALTHAQRLIMDLQRFIRSVEVSAYLELREKTYCQVFNRTVQYAESIVACYRECSMVITELRFAGDSWNDVGIRDCADRVGGLMSQCYTRARTQGVIGHAWRLDTVLAATERDPIGRVVWRVRWLTFVREEELGSACKGEEIAAILVAVAKEVLIGISSPSSFSSAVIKDMTPLFFEQPPVTESSEVVATYQQLIQRWVYELSMGEIYHRIRVLKGGRPMMCGRGHPSDGRPKKKSASRSVSPLAT